MQNLAGTGGQVSALGPLMFVVVRGQFHKAKKCVITRILFVITNISNFVFSMSTSCYLQFAHSKSFYTVLFVSNVCNINKL